MAIKKQKGGINQGLILLSGLLFVLGSIIIFLFILRGVFGRFSAQDLVPDSKIVKSVVIGKEPDVAILYSKYTENMLPEGSTWLSDNISTWKKFLGNTDHGYNIIQDRDIETGKLKDYKILILPGSKALSDREIIQIKKYIDGGGSIFATSGTATYSDDGKWRGWEFFSTVYGLKFSAEINRDSVTKIHTLRGGLPITANIPTGYPLKVATWDRPMAAEVLDPRTIQASFWYNYRLQNGLVREKIKESAGIVYGTYGKGRFIWMGFEINSIIGAQEDYVYFDRLFQNCVTWLSYGPIAYIKAWPSDFSAAAVIAPNLTNDVNNVKNLFGILSSEKVKASFFVTPYQAEQNKNLVSSLSRYGEVGALVDIGYLTSVNDTINSLNDLTTQEDKFKNAKQKIESISHSKVNGAEPYYGLYDQNTVESLIKDGYKYVITDSLTDRSVPKPLVRGEKLLISMTKTARDDYEVIRDFGLTEPNFQFYTYQEDVDRILFEGGLYIMKLHTDYQCRPEYAGVVKELIKDLKRKNYWITTASQIQQWWALRNYVETRVSKRGETRVALTITNFGKKTVDNLVVHIEMNTKARNIALSAEIIGTKLAKYQYDNDNRVMYLYINDLKPNESRTYYIDYDKPNA